jgi:hypothetical protein
MMDRVRVRCPVCRSTVPVEALWAVDNLCPRCSTRVYTARRRSAPAGVVGKALALLTADSAPSVIRAEIAKK